MTSQDIERGNRKILHFKKFWDAFMRRTLGKWFEGKCFQVIFDEYVPGDPFLMMLSKEKKEPHRIRYTKYILIIDIYFAFAQYHDQITVRYVEPHSTKIEKMWIKGSDWHNLSIEEDRESFTILRRFYPVERIEIKLPRLADLIV